ncbi:MAG: hypothetical protein RLZZ611_1951 [Cyanobacteriota bacterium]|jgi:hypothetical protein
MASTDATPSAAPQLRGLDVRLPEALASALEGYLASRPQLDANRLLQTALAQFLVQQGGARPEVRELYLDGLFGSSL